MSFRGKQCLNGWWDFLPVLTEQGKKHAPPGAIPTTGWLDKAIVVPGSWSRGGCAGQSDPDRPWEQWRLFDSYGFPPEWDATNTAWYRRTFETPAEPLTRWYLDFRGVLRHCWVFVNGLPVGRSTDPILPSEYDITGAVRPGENELVVYVTDYERNENGKTWSTTACDQFALQKGIWQDVMLLSRPAVHVDDVTIRTSTRRNELTVFVDITNMSDSPRTVQPLFTVHESDMRTQCLSFAASAVSVAPGKTERVEVTQPWSSYRPWGPRSPQLYVLSTHLADARGEGRPLIDQRDDRFGFREVWIEGPHIMLNGSPVHLSGDWCHKNTYDNLRPEYIRQWYGMIRDANMNYIRTHMSPHNENMMDIADEMGILVCIEATWMFGSGYALDDERFWTEGAIPHVHRLVRRDKNHPSVILYSVGNEVRWSGNQPAIIRNCPRLRAIYEQIDPTRIAYHDGDSSLWDERTQAIISRHYGLECTGEGWWDRSRPLHVGEMGKWHFGQPIDNLVFGNDDVFASFPQCHRAVALEAADVIQQARANGASCLFPWNLSGLDNYRPWPTERRHEWTDWSAPGVKPLRSAPYASEFAWWEPQSKGYSPGVSFDIIRHAFRPVAAMVRERLNHVFDDQPVRHTVTVVNDDGAELNCSLSVELLYGDAIVWRHEQPVKVAPGYTYKAALAVQPPPVRGVAAARIRTTLADFAQQYDCHERPLRVSSTAARLERWNVPPTAVLGLGPVGELLAAHGVKTVRVESIADARADQTPLLLIEKDAILAGSSQNKELEQFLAAGGRCVVLEQTASVLPRLGIDSKPSERCHIRGGRGDVLSGIAPEDLEYWGNDPYGTNGSDSWVVVSPFRKPDCGHSRVLVDSGFGDFGGGGLHWAPLVETRIGDGVVLCCQLRLSAKAATHPSALAILRRLVEYAGAWRAGELHKVQPVDEASRAAMELLGVQVASGQVAGGVVLASGDGIDSAAAAGLARRAFEGASVVVAGLSAPAVAAVASALGIDLAAVDLGTIYNLVRVKDDALLEGISNQETYWLDKAHYGPQQNPNRPITRVLMQSSSPSVEVLLASESQSAWREFYVHDAKSERLRMPVMTYYLWNGPRPSAAGLLRVRHGRGQIILCQAPLPTDAYGKALVFWTHIMRNLGAAASKSLIDGQSVAPGTKLSDGYPTSVSCIADPSPELLADILRLAAPQDRMPNHALRSGFAWQATPAEGGQLTAPAGAQSAVLTFQLQTGRPRMSVEVEGGLPNPNLQTMLDLYGEGSVRTIVNGREFQLVDLGAQRQGTVADIDLPAGYNTVILIWQPPAQGERTLRLQFRNRQRQPEVEFGFVPHV
jgi:hypothetical protein